MRVIAGKARSMPLKALKGNSVRPTTDRIKETLFNILMPDIPGSRFLDLFAGAGAIGIEALSRGAKEARFIEKSKEACEIIKANLDFTKLSDGGHIHCRDVSDGILELNGSGAFDVIFMDPPYGKGYGPEVLSLISRTDLADEYTIVVLEEDLSDEFEPGDVISGFEITRIKKYRSNRHIFLKRKADK